MDKITQTIFETILVKLEKIEKHIINQTYKKEAYKSTELVRNQGIRYASEAQIDYARRLSLNPWEEITHDEISKMIDDALERKNSYQTIEPKVYDTTGMTEKEINKLKKQLKEVVEPKDVDTENAGIDESGSM